MSRVSHVPSKKEDSDRGDSQSYGKQRFERLGRPGMIGNMIRVNQPILLRKFP